MMITLGVGIAGLNTGNNLLYLLFGMMLSFIILSGILSDVSMHKLKAFRTLPAEVSANALFPVKLTVLNNKKVIPAFSLSVEDVSEQSAPEKKFLVKVPPGETQDAYYFSKFHKRGIRKFAGFKLLTKYPFGLIQKTDFLAGINEVLVYPEIIDLKKILPGNRMFQGEYLSGAKGIGVNPWGLRGYFYGDDARLIHWKSTAKKGKWMIKEFESEKKLKVVLDLILVNPSGAGVKAYKRTAENALIEKLISLCASFVIYLNKINYEVALTINGKIINGSATRYISNYLRALALLNVDDFPLETASLNSPLNDDSTHVVVTNLSLKSVNSRITDIGLAIDRENYVHFDHGENSAGEVRSEI